MIKKVEDQKRTAQGVRELEKDISQGIPSDLAVPMREISLSPSHLPDGEREENEAVRVYDTSGAWGDPDFHGDHDRGLPALRATWIQGQAGPDHDRRQWRILVLLV